jgi:hypothetical protein
VLRLSSDGAGADWTPYMRRTRPCDRDRDATSAGHHGRDDHSAGTRARGARASDVAACRAANHLQDRDLRDDREECAMRGGCGAGDSSPDRSADARQGDSAVAMSPVGNSARGACPCGPGWQGCTRDARPYTHRSEDKALPRGG